MRRAATRAVTSLVCALIVLGFPAQAVGNVIANKCIARVGLWDSRERVAREWGLPISVTRTGSDTVWHYPTRSVVIYRWGKDPTPDRWIVTAIRTTDPRDRLRSGIGVGSWRSEVHAVSRRGCLAGEVSCDVVVGPNGGVTTSVTLQHNRVTALSMGLESSYDDGSWPVSYADKRCRDQRSQ